MAQELQAVVNINHTQIQGTNNAIFDNLQSALTQFLNDRKMDRPPVSKKWADSVQF